MGADPSLSRCTKLGHYGKKASYAALNWETAHELRLGLGDGRDAASTNRLFRSKYPATRRLILPRSCENRPLKLVPSNFGVWQLAARERANSFQALHAWPAKHPPLTIKLSQAFL